MNMVNDDVVTTETSPDPTTEAPAPTPEAEEPKNYELADEIHRRAVERARSMRAAERQDTKWRQATGTPAGVLRPGPGRPAAEVLAEQQAASAARKAAELQALHDRI